MPLYLVPPVTVTDAILISSNVPETDYAAYAAGTTYALGNRVIVTTAGVHKIYESLQASNVGHDPTLAASSTWWVTVSATNKWAMFDTSTTSATTVASPLSITVTPGQAITSVALLGLVGTSVRIRVTDPIAGTVYDQTTSIAGSIPSADWYNYFTSVVYPKTTVIALDIPSYVNCSVLVDITGTGTVSCGTFVMGYQIPIGATDISYGAKVGIVDYSTKKTDAYGNTNLSKGVYALRATFSLQLNNTEVDNVQNLLANYRATPCMWIGNTGFASTQIFGIYQSFDVTIAYPFYSICQLDLLGLT